MKNITILYVEDDKNIQEKLAKELTYLCDTLVVCDDGLEGLEAFKSNDIDIVISDIKMPNLNGIEMVKEIKKINQDVSVLLTTAHNDAQYFLEAIKSRVDGYLLKPIRLNILEDEINKLVTNINTKKELEEYKENLKLTVEKQEQDLQYGSKFTSLGEIISSVAKQLQHPTYSINSILSTIELKKQMGIRTKEDIDKSFKDIQSSLNEISTTIDKFTDFLRDEDFENVDTIQSSLETTTRIMMRELFTRYNINIEFNYTNIEPSHQVKINNNTLDQIIINIYKYIIDRTIKQNIKNTQIVIECSHKDGDIIIEISDNTGQVPQDILSKILESNSSTSDDNSVNLGLYLSKKMAKIDMDGDLNITNSNEGTKFTISFPK